LIPRWWRYRLSPEDEARVLAAMVLSDKKTRIVRPRWQPIASTRPEARALESLERTFIIRLNDRDQPLTAREIGATYENIRKYEITMDMPGSDERLERILWEIKQYEQRLSRDAAIGAVSEAASHEPAQPPASPMENDPALEWRHDVEECLRPRDEFHPPVESIDRLRLEIDRRRNYLAQFNLAESMARRLDDELACARLGRKDADGAAAQLAILDRWIARLEVAYARSQLLVGKRAQAAAERAGRPREHWEALTIDPRFKGRDPPPGQDFRYKRIR
jgi:hypothetical protein